MILNFAPIGWQSKNVTIERTVMRKLQRSLLAVVLVWMTVQAQAEPGGCEKCHDAEEFDGLDAEAVREALTDTAIPPHRKFAELTEAEVKALLEAH